MTGREVTPPSACPICGMRDRPGDLVCPNCGLPIAGSTDPISGVAPGRPTSTIDGPSTRASLAGLVIVISLMLVAGTLATSGGGFLRYGGRIGMSSPTLPAPDRAARPTSENRSLVSRAIDAEVASTIDQTESTSAYSCDDSAFRATRARWGVAAIRAGSRRGFERVTIELKRNGKAKNAARVTATWMSPADARRTFGLPRFAGQRGLLLTFAGPVTATATQLIGPADLTRAGIRSISGIYRFVDGDGRAHTFVAILDDSCARIRAPRFRSGERGSGSPRIVLDLGTP